MTRYVDMTPDQRRECYQDNRQAMAIHADGFAMRPVSSRSADAAAMRDWRKATREAKFILRIAKSRGDEWAKRERIA